MRQNRLLIAGIMAAGSLLSGCAPVQPRATSVASAPAAPAPVEGPRDTGIFGIVMLKQLGGFPECPNEPSSPYRYHFNRTAALQYQMYSSYACFQHNNEGYIGGSAGGTEIVWVKWPISQSPALDKGSGAGVSIIDGVVHGINLSTLGVDSQQRDYELLVAKFGKPGLKRLVSKQNRMGATFEIIEAAWERPDGITILFQGAGSSLDAGTVKVQTTREAARLKELREQANVGKPKL